MSGDRRAADEGAPTLIRHVPLPILVLAQTAIPRQIIINLLLFTRWMKATGAKGGRPLKHPTGSAQWWVSVCPSSHIQSWQRTAVTTLNFQPGAVRGTGAQLHGWWWAILFCLPWWAHRSSYHRLSRGPAPRFRPTRRIAPYLRPEPLFVPCSSRMRGAFPGRSSLYPGSGIPSHPGTNIVV